MLFWNRYWNHGTDATATLTPALKALTDRKPKKDTHSIGVASEVNEYGGSAQRRAREDAYRVEECVDAGVANAN